MQTHIIQFLPYYSPHIGGVEKVGEGIHENWTYGKKIIVTSDIGQDIASKRPDIIFLPFVDIIPNFPFPLFWKKEYRQGKKRLQDILKQHDFTILTHTRFFLSSFVGGRCAKKNNCKWIHIEHGSDYVKLSSRLKSYIAYLYDKTFGSYVIHTADRVFSISMMSKDFIEKAFSREEVLPWYRGIDVPKISKKDTLDICLVYIGRLVHLKRVHDIVEVYKSNNISIPLYIIGDGDEMQSLKRLAVGHNIIFLGSKSQTEVYKFLSNNNCILVNPSSQEGMPTTVIEALATKNIVIATDVGGTREISQHPDLKLYSPGDKEQLGKYIDVCQKEYFQIASQSYQDIEKNFSWEKSVDNLYEMMKK